MIGKTLSSYTIVDTLGTGGMGAVYLAKDTRLGRTVALKVLPEKLATDPRNRARFTLEARSASALNHPNVAHIYDVGEVDGVSFIVMEHIEGETLAKRLSRGPISIDEAIDVVSQVADALADAHERHITHRDIKPANVMLTRRGQVKVLDFGLARLGYDTEHAETHAATVTQVPAEMTAVGQVLGTVPYMSPEQARGVSVDPRTDVFSLGVVLYEMLAGRRPFDGRTPGETMERIVRGAPADVTDYNEAVPLPLAHVVRRCLEPNPERRYPTARELLSALGSCTTSPSRAPATSAAPSQSGPSRVDDLGRIQSIAVMPFDNASGEEEAAYLCDGLAENLIATLARFPDLRVISRHATFALRDEPKDIRVLGERLEVDALVLGDLRPRGDRIVVNVELVGVPDGRRLWGDRYDRTLAEAAAVERDIAEKVAEQLEEALSSQDVPGVEQREVDPQAYLLYLKGRSLLIGSATQMKSGAEYLKEAAEKDPSYALPHAALAESYMLQAFHSVLDMQDARKLARAAARKAVELDPDLPETHTVLGIIRFMFDWDFEGAEESFRRAIEMGPGRDVPHLEYADFLAAIGRLPEALEMAARARELDPVSPNPAHLTAYTLLLMQDYAGAIREFKAAIALHPNWIWGHIKLAGAYSRNAQHDEALKEIEIAEAALHGGGTPLARSWLARVYGAAGCVEKANAILAELEDTDDKSADPIVRAYVFAGFGDTEGVLDCLEKAVRQHSALAGHLLAFDRLEPQLDLGEEPRFMALVEKVGIPLSR